MGIFQNSLMGAAASAAAGGETAYQLWAWGYCARKPVPCVYPYNNPPYRLEAEPGDWLKVVVGAKGGHAINDSGELFGWGYGAKGRIGVGNTTTYSGNGTPPYVQIGTDTDWAKVGDTAYSITAIKTDGTLWSWGENTNGRLGNGNTTDICSPVQVGSLTDWASVSYGPSRADAMGAIKTDGTLWTWGNGSYGAGGHGNTTNYSSPVQVGALTDWATLTGGEGAFFVALKTDGTMWSWGGGSRGKLGHGNTTNQSSPVQIGSLTTWAKARALGQFSGAVKTDGTIWMWGYNSRGQLGQGNTTGLSSPVQVGTLTDWADLSGSYNSAIGLKTDNTIWGWGRGSAFQVNGTTTADLCSPVQIGTDTDWRVITGTAALKGEAL